MKKNGLIAITMTMMIITGCAKTTVVDETKEPLNTNDIVADEKVDDTSGEDEIDDDVSDEDENSETNALSQYAEVPEEYLDNITLKFETAKQCLAQSDMDDRFYDFVTGQRYAEFVSGEDKHVVSAFSFDELYYEGMEESMMACTLVDVNKDGVDELYYTVTSQFGEFTYKMILAIDEEDIRVIYFFESHSPNYDCVVTSDGMIAEENTVDAYKEYYSFDEYNDLVFVEGLYSNEYASEEEYNDACHEKYLEYEATNGISLMVLN